LFAAILVGAYLLWGCSLRDASRASADPYQGPPRQQSHFLWPEGIRAAVSLTFDDARPSQIDVGLPIFNEYRVPATFYVSPHRLKARLRDWQKVARSEHEIGNHSLRHPCTGNFPWARDKALEDYTLNQMKEELQQANATIESLLHVRPVTFAYPCGQKYVGRGKEVRSYVPLVAEMFLSGRGWMDEGANDPTFCDLAQLLGVELDGLESQQAKKLIEKAAENGFWLVFCGHEIGQGGRQTTRADTLAAICDYARDSDNGIWIDTVESIAHYVQEAQMAAAEAGS
jgi:peptidoglycan/xylan/chitin deacetylase (PgdA/CDA1 family)